MKNISAVLFIIALILLVLDIFLRRFRINLIPERKKKVKLQEKANTDKDKQKDDSVKKSGKSKKDTKPKAKEPQKDIIDTSALLNRMKK